MPTTLLSAAAVCVAALAIGQGVLRICGRRRWSWQAAPVGFATLLLLCVPSIHAPGGPKTIAVAIAVLTVASIATMVREPGLRPPVSGLAAALPALLLTIVPYVSSDRWGTLAVSFANDMSVHLLEAEGYASASVFDVNGISDAYPLGPHAVVGAFAGLSGQPVDYVFGGMMIAGVVLLAWSALALLRGAGWLAQTVVATLTSMTFLAAAFYAEASFKEIMLALLLLGLAANLERDGRTAGRWRWVPAALIVGGILSVYSYTGLVWVVATVAVWIAGLLVAAQRRGELRSAASTAMRAELAPLGVALAAGVVVVAPQSKRLLSFFEGTSGGLDTGALGNLVGPLPIWETFGIWGNPDFRLAPADPLTNGAWAAAVLALVAFGLVWWIRRRDWALPATVIAAFLVWVLSDQTQSPYNAAKALMVMAPFVMLLAARPLVERASWPQNIPRGLALAAPLIVLVLVFKVLDSSWSALRTAQVGPRDHMLELRSLRSTLGEGRTLFIGNDDFIRWSLAGVPVDGPVIVSPRLPMRPEKAWEYGQPLDVDVVDAALLNQYEWVVTPRDAAASEMPEQLRLVRTTRNYEVWRREGEVRPRSLLAEHGGSAGAVLDCRLPEGRALADTRGVAGVRSRPVRVPAQALSAGATTTVSLPLRAGTWDLLTPYVSSIPVRVTGAGIDTTLPANLDRPGNRWPIGQVELAQDGVVELQLTADDHALSPSTLIAVPNEIIAAPVDDERIVPLRKACGRYVDWYRTEP